ncbi:ketohexokinase [Mucor ambiguus]|uniref:Ketohexokinase n=1 Tax=Mucor ambiguus TaxID=91626 RepID=A0A0C9N5L9_9FUNG|nr:ketohexokinase [Mucor ambiguus]
MVFSFSKRSKNSRLIIDESSSGSSISASRSSSFDQPLSPTLPDTLNSKTVNVLIVGQVYQDTIMTVDYYPGEDTKVRSSHTQQRRGGNCVNTAEVLAQFPKMNPFIMSAVGPKDSSSNLLAQLESKGVKTSSCFYRKSPTPSCYIIQCKDTGSRTIISSNTTQDITKDEFARKVEMSSITKTMSFEFDARPAYSWVHFEGRNVYETAAQIDWLEAKAKREGWRNELTISVELEKPDRPHIDILLTRGDVVFFSKLYAEKRGYDEATDFLRDFQARCKPGAILFCTWGAQGATCLFKGDILHSSALAQAQVVDTVGAGDTFIAGVIYCMTRGHTLLTTLKFSCEMASRKVSRSGFDGLADTMFKVWETSLGAELNKAHYHAPLLHSKSYENGFLGFDFGTLTSRRSGMSHKKLLSHSSSAPLLKNNK